MSIEFGPDYSRYSDMYRLARVDSDKHEPPMYDNFSNGIRTMSVGGLSAGTFTMSFPPLLDYDEVMKTFGLKPKKAVTMSNADQKLQEELEAKRLEAELERKRAAIESIGPEPTDTNHIAFNKKFEDHEGATVYNYAAVKVSKTWYTTTGSGMRNSMFESWDALVLFLVSGAVPTESVTPLYPKPLTIS